MLSKIVASSILAVSVGKALAAVQFGGLNVAGFDFGVDTTGTCNLNNIDPPLTQYGGSDGAGQMQHFSKDIGLNIYRLPVAWQYLTKNVVRGPLDPTNFAKYDTLVQACLGTGSHCVIDIHNYARWNGNIIGQSSGGPTNADFAQLWKALATHYASDTGVIFGLMNEPHDIPDVNLWGVTVQAAVSAIRQTGATSQYILLPGTDYTSAKGFLSDGSAAALINVTNLDGSTTNLIFDLHQYLDSDGSGTHTNCVTDHVADTFTPLATYLRQNKRMALLSEIGGGSNDPSCLTGVCSALSYLNENSDVYLGYLGWAAGAFATSYTLGLTPSGSAAAGWVDQPLLTQCFQKEFTGGDGGTPRMPTPVPSSSTSAASLLSSYIASSASAESTTLVLSPSTTSAAGPTSKYSANPAPSASASISTSAAAVPLFTSSPAGYTSTLCVNSTAGANTAPSASSSTVISYYASGAPYGYRNGSSIGYGTVRTSGSVPTTFSTRISSSAIASVSPSATSSSGGAGEENVCEADF